MICQARETRTIKRLCDGITRATIKNPRQSKCSDEGGGEEEVVTNTLNCKSTSTLQQNYDAMS
jgi:hypothetical protein